MGRFHRLCSLITLFAITTASNSLKVNVLDPQDGAVIFSPHLGLVIRVEGAPEYDLEVKRGGDIVYTGRVGQPVVTLTLQHLGAGPYVFEISAKDSGTSAQGTAGVRFHIVHLEPFETVEASGDEVINELPTDSALVEHLTQFALDAYSVTTKLEWLGVLSARRVGVAVHAQSCLATGAKTCSNSPSAWYYITGDTANAGPFIFKLKVEWTPEGDPAAFLMGAGKVAEMSHIPQHLLRAPPVTVSEFAEEHQCRDHEPQVEDDLRFWKAGQTQFGSEWLHALNNDAMYYAARFQIINNSIYFVQPLQNRQQAHRNWFYDCLVNTLLALAARVRLPDVDFLVGGEVPQALIGGNRPIFSMTKSIAHEDILVPDLFFWYWDGTVEAVHPFYKPPRIKHTDGAKSRAKWDQRKPKLWWKGTVGGWKLNARGHLVQLGRQHPDLIEATPLRLTGPGVDEAAWAGWEVTDDLRRGTNVPEGEQESHKYVANTHGNGNDWSNRFRALLSTESVVFKQDSTLWEYWERDIQPWVHYVPVARNLSDVPEKIQWARDHDEQARDIAINGAQFVRDALRMDDVFCYWARLLHSYAELVPQPVIPAKGATHFQMLLPVSAN